MSDETKTSVSFFKSNKNYIHIALEVVVLVIICYYFSSRHSIITDRVNEMSEKVTKQQEEIEELKTQLQTLSSVDTQTFEYDDSELINRLSSVESFITKITQQRPPPQRQRPPPQPQPQRQPQRPPPQTQSEMQQLQLPQRPPPQTQSEMQQLQLPQRPPPQEQDDNLKIEPQTILTPPPTLDKSVEIEELKTPGALMVEKQLQDQNDLDAELKNELSELK